MAIAFIAGGVIGGLFGVALALSYELKTMQYFKRKLEDLENVHNLLRTQIPQKLVKDVLEMLNMYCDDDNEIYIKKRVLEVNMQSILEEFV